VPIPVRLRNVVEQMDMAADDRFVYLNKRTGEFVAISEEDRGLVEEGDETDWADAPAWHRELLLKIKGAMESDDYLALPGKFEIHEWSIMERFSASVEKENHRGALLDSIHGSGAFRRFKDTICRLGVEDDWYKYRDRAIGEIAVEWLEVNDIPFVRDTKE